MKYLRVQLRTDTEGVVYEKDVDVRNALDPFIRGRVSDLVMAGLVQKGEHYVALAIPRYGDGFQTKLTAHHDPVKVEEPRDWIELLFEEPTHPDKPIRFFTIELRIRERGLVFRQDFTTGEVREYYVGYGVSQALLRLGLLRAGDIYFTNFFARDDDQADFYRESMPSLQKRAASLVELVDDDSPAIVSFPGADPDRYGEVDVVGALDPGQIRIYIRREAMSQLVEEGRRSTEAERGGMLVGQVFENIKGGRRIVEISDLSISEHTRAGVAELRYTFESWQAHQTVMKERFPGKKVVGWYHTHLIRIPPHKAEDGTDVEATALFFSPEDVFLHRQFFSDEWYVAMVLDPEGRSLFFQWKDEDVAACRGYCIFEDVGVAGVKEGA